MARYILKHEVPKEKTQSLYYHLNLYFFTQNDIKITHTHLYKIIKEILV